MLTYYATQVHVRVQVGLEVKLMYNFCVCSSLAYPWMRFESINRILLNGHPWIEDVSFDQNQKPLTPPPTMCMVPKVYWTTPAWMPSKLGPNNIQKCTKLPPEMRTPPLIRTLSAACSFSVTCGNAGSGPGLWPRCDVYSEIILWCSLPAFSDPKWKPHLLC